MFIYKFRMKSEDIKHEGLFKGCFTGKKSCSSPSHESHKEGANVAYCMCPCVTEALFVKGIQLG